MRISPRLALVGIAVAAAAALGVASPAQSDEAVAPAVAHLVEANLAVADPAGASGIAVDGARLAEAIDRIPASDRTAPGYAQDSFEFWSDPDGNGIDGRNEILGRDLANPTWDGGRVTAGTLHDPYTGAEIIFIRGRDTSGAVQIDHIVPREAAWNGGADQWSPELREQFANDPVELIAVDGPTNGAKGADLPGEWMPSNSDYACAYVAQVAYVLVKYQLAAPAADLDAMRSTAAGCHGSAAGALDIPVIATGATVPADYPAGEDAIFGIPREVVIAAAILVSLVAYEAWRRSRASRRRRA